MSRSRFFWILLAAVALAYITCGLSRISFNVDILRLLPSHLRQVEGLSLFLKHFAQPDELIVTIDAPDAETAEAAADKLAAALRQHATLVKSATARPPWENDPASLSEFLTFLLLNQPADKMDGIRRKLAPDQAGNTLRETLDTLRTSVSPRDLALLSYDPSSDAGRNLASMTDSASAVLAAEVTQSVRDTEVEAGVVHEGDWIGLTGKGIVTIDESLVVCATRLLDSIVSAEHELVTIIEGEGSTASNTRRLSEWLQEERPDVAVEVHHGGQPL